MRNTLGSSWAKYFNFAPDENKKPQKRQTPTPILLADLAQLTTNSQHSMTAKHAFDHSQKTLLPSSPSPQRKKSLFNPPCTPGNMHKSEQGRQTRYSNNRRPKRPLPHHKQVTLGDFNARIICPFNFYRPSKTKKVRQGTSLSVRTQIEQRPQKLSKITTVSQNKWLKITALSPSNTHNPDQRQFERITYKSSSVKPWYRQASIKRKLITQPSPAPTQDFKAWQTSPLHFDFEESVC